MVGDWPERDIKGARKLGIKTVYARYGNVNASGGYSPEFTINDIHELVGIVDYLNDQEELFDE
jgi:putative hydrolase of the HAD superfamily